MGLLEGAGGMGGGRLAGGTGDRAAG